MATATVSAFGRYVAVGTAGCGAEGISCVSPGLGMKAEALLNGVDVAGSAQLERSSTKRTKTK